MIEERRTKAQLIEALDETREQLDEMRNRKEVAIERPAVVPEADALAQCIRALDRLANEGKSSGSYGYSSRMTSNDVQRVLQALGVKYGLPPAEKVIEPCNRRHVDEIDAGFIRDAMQQAPVSPEYRF